MPDEVLDSDNDEAVVDDGYTDFLDSEKEDEIEAKQSEEQEPKAKDDDKEYSQNVQKRIGKEVSKRKVLESEIQSLNARLSDFERQVNESKQASTDEALNARLKAVAEKRKEMYELGDIDPDLEDQYQDLRFEARQNKARKEQSTQETQQPTNQRQIPKAQQDWMIENSDWYGVDQQRTAEANQVFQSILDDGFSENHPRAYSEFNKRLQGDTQPTRQREQSPPPASPSGPTSTRKSKAKLTTADFEMMSAMGMDPHNPEHRKQLLSQKGA